MSGWLRFALNKPNQYLGWLSHSHDILITWLMSWIHQCWSKVHDSPVINRKYLQLYHGCFMDIQIFTSIFPWTNRFPMDFPISNQHFPWIFHGFPRKNTITERPRTFSEAELSHPMSHTCTWRLTAETMRSVRDRSGAAPGSQQGQGRSNDPEKSGSDLRKRKVYL